MSQMEFIDRLFDTINESDNLPIQDVVTDAEKNIIKVYLTDGSIFQIQCKNVDY